MGGRWTGALAALVLGLGMACSAGTAPPEATGPLPVDGAVEAARAIVADHAGEEIGVCDPEGGWGYAALRALTRADDQAAAAHAAVSDRKLAPLTSTDLFEHWMRSRTVPLDGDDALRALFRQSSAWYDASGEGTRRLVLRANGVFELRKIGTLGEPESSGEWSVDQGQLWLDLESGRRGITVERGPYSLELDLGVLGKFKPEPMLGDC